MSPTLSSSAAKDPRIKQSNKEALLTLGAYGLYFLWWYGFAYGLGDGDPDQYSYVLGLPAWFFYSCVAGYIVLSVLLWLMVRFFFKDVSLDDKPDDAEPSVPHGAVEIADERRSEVL